MLVPPICTATVYYSGRAVVPVEYLKKRVPEESTAAQGFKKDKVNR